MAVGFALARNCCGPVNNAVDVEASLARAVPMCCLEQNLINAFAGADTINGLGGVDVLEGGADFDVIDGGEGNDSCSLGSSNDGQTLN